MTQVVFIGLRDAETGDLSVWRTGAPDCFEFNGNTDGLADLVKKRNALPLDPRWDIYNHSPNGFECGYTGSGPAQLALAIAAVLFGDGRALLLEWEIMNRCVAGLSDTRDWCLTERDVRHALKDCTII